MNLDHIAISGETLAEARAHVEEALGVSLQAGGEHDVFFTHNALLGLEDGLYLEAIAINPAAPAPDRPRWFDLDRFTGPPRLTNWICRCDDLEATLAVLGVDFGAAVALRRGDLRWRMAVPETGSLPFDNRAPALIEWQAGGHPVQRLAASHVRLRRLTIRHPEADVLQDILQGQLNDDRLSFEAGLTGMAAAFDTPHGPREIAG
jgi:hypothetical protein